MKLIKNLLARKGKRGESVSWALYFCTYCGKEVERRLRGKTQHKKYSSCGCARGATISKAKTQHGDSRNGENRYLFSTWREIIFRCQNPKCVGYKRYGGRGIKICDRWLFSYTAFKSDALKLGWKRGLQIDRINNDGDYEPSNCRFVTSAKNNQNRSDTKLTWEAIRLIRLFYRVGLFTQSVLAKKYDVNQANISEIVNNKQWVRNCQ